MVGVLDSRKIGPSEDWGVGGLGGLSIGVFFTIGILKNPFLCAPALEVETLEQFLIQQ